MRIKELTKPHQKHFASSLIQLLRDRGWISRLELELLIEQEENQVLYYICDLLEIEDPADICGTVEWDEYVVEQYLMCKQIYLDYIWEEYSYEKTILP